jgi:hypothetical protein
LARVVNFIVSCTNRKRFEASPETSVHGVGGENLAARLKLWKRNLRSATAGEHRADDVYMGDHWSVVRTIPSEARASGLSVQVWICSAGYGLIRPETPIKAYRATFTRGEDDYIASGLIEDERTLNRWWDGVCSYRFATHTNVPRTLSGIADAFPRTPIVVALSADYLKAVADDLAEVLVRPYFRDHLSIVSCGTPQPHAIWKHHLLPCNASLAGGLGGALTSLNARVARRLFQSLDKAELTVESLTKLADSIDRTAGGSTPSGIPRSDNDVACFIRVHLAKFPSTSKTRLLQEFRGKGLACEQQRFGTIYARVRNEASAGINA